MWSRWFAREAPPLSTDCSWNSTGFTSGDSLLWTFNAWKGGNGPLTLAFGSGVVGAGAHPIRRTGSVHRQHSGIQWRLPRSAHSPNKATRREMLYNLGVLDGSGGNITSVVV